MNEYIIGMDFGNFYSQLCIILGMDPKTRRGGVLHNLMDPYSPCKNGIPSIFYYSASKNDGKPIFGYKAERERPVENGVRYLKRHLKEGESIVIDGKTFTYLEMITEIIQYCVREANKQLMMRHRTTSNLITLPYPAGISRLEQQNLVSAAEKATLEDGTPIKVVGLICEPAAAALDYEASLPTPPQQEVIMTYDLGGGTFDVSLTQVYPNGKKRSDGSTYYYDFIDNAGNTKLGGLEFDEIMRKCIIENAGKNKLDGRTLEQIKNAAEPLKRELTFLDEVPTGIFLPNGEEIPPVKREQFNEKAKKLVDDTIALMKEVLSKPGNPRPDKIILCGGASQMPIVMERLCAEFPEYKRDVTILPHNPSMAISAGAARFAIEVPQTNSKTQKIDTSATQLRTIYDIGVRYLDGETDEKGHITCFIPANTPIPFQSDFIRSHMLSEGRYSLFQVFEANKGTPDSNEPARDYNCVCSLDYDNGVVVPKGTEHKTRLVVDGKGLLHLEVHSLKDKNAPPQVFDCVLENLK